LVTGQFCGESSTNFLGQILGLGSLSRHAKAVREQPIIMAVEQACKGLSVSICCRLGQVFVAGCHTHHGDETDANGQSLVGFGIYLAVGLNMREKCSA
jgi:hypothetical protein